MPRVYTSRSLVRGGGVPGVGMTGVAGGLYRYPTHPYHIPVFSHILALRPYLRPNEGNSELFSEVSEIGSRIGSRIDLKSTRIDLKSTLQDPLPQLVPRWPQMTLR